MLSGLAPVWRRDARVLILGSFPGTASLAVQQYYAHPRNAFWPAMGRLLGQPGLAQQPYAQRLQSLQSGGIALWDVIAQCERQGSLDADIRAAQPSALAELTAALPALRAVACNGAAAHRQALAQLPAAAWPVLRLPSSSPAHASCTLDEKCAAWVAALSPFLGAASRL